MKYFRLYQNRKDEYVIQDDPIVPWVFFSFKEKKMISLEYTGAYYWLKGCIVNSRRNAIRQLKATFGKDIIINRQK